MTNAVAIETDLLGELLLSGPGAGGNATASAVIGDVADIAKSRPGFQHGPVFGTACQGLAAYNRAKMPANMRAAISFASRYMTALALLRRLPGAWRKATFRWNRSCSAAHG